MKKWMNRRQSNLSSLWRKQQSKVNLTYWLQSCSRLCWLHTSWCLLAIYGIHMNSQGMVQPAREQPNLGNITQPSSSGSESLDLRKIGKRIYVSWVGTGPRVRMSYRPVPLWLTIALLGKTWMVKAYWGRGTTPWWKHLALLTERNSQVKMCAPRPWQQWIMGVDSSPWHTG